MHAIFIGIINLLAKKVKNDNTFELHVFFMAMGYCVSHKRFCVSLGHGDISLRHCVFSVHSKLIGVLFRIM